MSAGRIVARTFVDAAAFAAVGGGLAALVGWSVGERVPAVGLAVAVAWTGACAGLGGRTPGEPGLVACLLGALGAAAGLFNGLYAQALLETGSIDAGLARAQAGLAPLLQDRRVFALLGAALPFAYAVHARASGWTLRAQLAEPCKVVAPILAILWALLGVAWSRGHTDRALGPLFLTLASLALLAWSCGPTLVYALADRLEPRLLGPGGAASGGHDGPPRDRARPEP